MPIKKELYHPYWNAISLQIREQAGWRCEGTPNIPSCRAKNGKPHPVTGSKVVLTVAHMDQDPSNNDPANLRALCQRCHFDWDRPYNMEKAEKTRRIEKFGTHPTQYKLILQYQLEL